MEPVNRAPAELEAKENVFLGVIGALLFSLAGALVYFILNRVGYIASLSALVGAYCACFGYGLFTRKKGTKAGMISAAAATVIVMVLAVVFCLAFDLYEYIKDDYANVKLTEVLGTPCAACSTAIIRSSTATMSTRLKSRPLSRI